MEIADFLEKWQTDERSVEESLEYLKSFLTIFSSLSRDDQQVIPSDLSRFSMSLENYRGV